MVFSVFSGRSPFDLILTALLVLVFGSALLWALVHFMGLDKWLKMYLDKRTAKKLSYEIRALDHEERLRDSPIQRATLDDVRRYDPTLRAVERTIEGEERERAARERWKRRYK